MSKIITILNADTSFFCWDDKGSRIEIDLHAQRWTLDNVMHENLNSTGAFELTPDTQEVCSFTETQPPTIVIKAFKACGYDLESIVPMDDDDDDELIFQPNKLKIPWKKM